MRSTGLGSKKLPNKDFKLSFQQTRTTLSREPQPLVTKSTTTTTNQKRLKIFAPVTKTFKNVSVVSKLPDEFQLKLKPTLQRHISPKNLPSHAWNKENICPNKILSHKLSNKTVDNDEVDEGIEEHSNSIVNHRFSDIYKPSKFLEQNKSKFSLGPNHAIPTRETSTKTGITHESLHTRNRSWVNMANSIPNCVTLPDYGVGENNYTEEGGDEPVYMLTEGYDSMLRDKEHEDFCNMMRRNEFEDEKKWSFQQPYKMQKSYIERKDGDDMPELSEAASSCKKSMHSTQKKFNVSATCDSLGHDFKASMTCAYSGGVEDFSDRKLPVRDLTNMMLSTFNKGSGSKLDSSIALTTSSTSEGIAYRSANLNMLNYNPKNHFPKLLQNYKDSFIDYKAKAALEVTNNVSLQSKVMARDNKPSLKQKITNIVGTCKEKVQGCKPESMNERRMSKSRVAGLTKAYNKQEQEQEIKMFECEEVITFPAAGPSLQSNDGNPLFMNPLTFYCDESLEDTLNLGGGKLAQQKQQQEEPVSKRQSMNVKPVVEIKPVKKTLSLEEEIQLWAKNSTKEANNSSDMYEQMLVNECNTLPDAYYLDKQSEINWLMRAILIDWMIEVAEEFCMKRYTLYTAINYVDRYLSIVPNVKKGQLQLLGTTSLMIAYKMEETDAIRIKHFSRATDDAYSVDQLKETELDICHVLRWKLLSNNLFVWANWYMQKWDPFLENILYSDSANVLKKSGKNPIYFKKPHEQSYGSFRELIQILDVLLLDIETLQYNQRAIIASLMYLMVGKHYQQFELSTVVNEFSRSSAFLSKELLPYNSFFSQFLKIYFEFEMEDLFSTIQYVAPYFAVKISFETPIAMKQDKSAHTVHFEEFFCLQTHSPENLPMIKEIARRKA